MRSSTETVADPWSMRPPQWVASWLAWFNGWGAEAATKRALQALDLAEDQRVCDLGFGLGVTLPHLLAALPRGQVVGVDPSPQMVRLATRQFQPWVRAGRLQLVEAFPQRLPFEDACFDAVVTIDGVHRWPDLGAGFGEAARVLGPDGRLITALGADQDPETPEACVEVLRDLGFAVAIEDEPDGSVLLVASPVQ